MLKNTSSQKLCVYAFDSTANTPKTGDAANITAYVNKDYAGLNVLGDTTATEVDATNAKGFYIFDLTQAETNADILEFSAKSATANIVVLATPPVVFTRPPRFTTLVIDASGLADANAVKVGPSGSGTAQTAKDLSTLLTSALTESYGTDGSTFTAAQALYQIWSFLAEKNISGTTLTAKKLDGSTTSMTFTLNDGTNPTTITRAT